MVSSKERIERILRLTLEKCLQWVKIDENGICIYEDPNDKVEISAHYGATHVAAAFIIWGIRINDNDLYQRGISLLTSILDRWPKSMLLPAFHFDFNNFALCVVYKYIESEDSNLSKRLKEIVLSTEDSNHFTINWLPMRWYVNKCRYEWTGKSEFKENVDRFRSLIKKATNNDGGIEDRLPKGKSFNLQYDIATTSLLQFLNISGETLDISKELGFLLNAVAPDGDINYQGRGTNQIFAWSGWIYLLSSSSKDDDLNVALDYIEDKVPIMLDKNNMMLNNWDGIEKFLWWDYHYCSVYIAHFLFWLVLSLEHYGRNHISEKVIEDGSTGLKIYRTKNYFVSLFEGRTEYLAERGPSIAAIWTKKQGMLVKGCFAPWLGAFGNTHTFPEVAIRNFIGMLEVKVNKKFQSNNRILRRLLSVFQREVPDRISYKTLFVPIKVVENQNALELTFSCSQSHKVEFNIPFIGESQHVQLKVDSQIRPIYRIMDIRNQYDFIHIGQTPIIKAKEITLVIE